MSTVHWLVYAGVVLAVLSPWVGLIVLLVVQSHLVDRIGALEEKMIALTGELGWKEK